MKRKYLRHWFYQIVGLPHFERHVAARFRPCQASIGIASDEHWQGTPTSCGNVCVLRSVGHCFSEKIKPLIATKRFPMREEVFQASKTLNQRPKLPLRWSMKSCLFFWRRALQITRSLLPWIKRVDLWHSIREPLNKCELHQSSLEKEVCALLLTPFENGLIYLVAVHSLWTDQQSVSLMYDVRHSSKTKTEKKMRWSTQLNDFGFEVVFRPGKLISVPDALSRAYCASLHESTLYTIHASLCHSGITRVHHFVRAKNLPCSLADVRKTVECCCVCSEVKPNFM